MDGEEMAGAVLGIANGINQAAQQSLGACRETAQGIARNQHAMHVKEAAAWRWLDNAMSANPLTIEEEESLWNLLCRARRERY